MSVIRGAAVGFVAVAVLSSTLAADDHGHSSDERPAVLLSDLGSHRHPVSTRSASAQRFFDQGLTLIYGFNHDYAVRSFRRAAELDPQLAMAWWGIALGLGPNYNMPEVDPAQAKAGYEALQKALSLAAPPEERAYIEALAKRYSADPKADGRKLLVDYMEAMKQLAGRSPDDLDAATLYAESIMNLRPWRLWNADGTPAEGTVEAVAMLESVLRRNPNHPGANHYYIHAVEASSNPERALPSADRLGALVPGAGHLVHMPGHIYFRIGDYEGAARANRQAILADRAFLQQTGTGGIYAMMYFSHNIHFLAAARSMQGRFEDAKAASDELAAQVAPHVEAMPMLEAWMAMPSIMQIRFRRWDDLLAAPAPASSLRITTAIRHFGRGLAHAAKGNSDEAERSLRDFVAARQAIPADTVLSEANKAQEALAVAEHVLAGRLALARNQPGPGLEQLRAAVKAEDALNYTEPPDAFARAREFLGGALLRRGEFAEAEAVFRADLAKQPRNGRSLFGLRESLQGQRKDSAARMVDGELEAAWSAADRKPLSLDDL